MMTRKTQRIFFLFIILCVLCCKSLGSASSKVLQVVLRVALLSFFEVLSLCLEEVCICFSNQSPGLSLACSAFVKARKGLDTIDQEANNLQRIIELNEV